MTQQLQNKSVAIIGAGIGGLAAALALSGRGVPVTVLEAAEQVGGKIATADIDHGGARFHIDRGPTVFTMKPVFDALFASVGLDFDTAVPTVKLDILARHFWPAQGQGHTGLNHLDLFADTTATADAIGQFSGSDDARAFVQLAADAQRIFDDLFDSFMRAPSPNLLHTIQNTPAGGLPLLAIARPWTSLWNELCRRFKDRRLVQMFARYATYCGANPFKGSALLMLILHAELSGVWRIDGGMIRLAQAFDKQVRAAGGDIRTATRAVQIKAISGGFHIETADGQAITASHVIMNGDMSALQQLVDGPERQRAPQPISPSQRSLSAVTASFCAQPEGLELEHHNVLFSSDYRKEFADIEAGQRPNDPSLYICQQAGGTQAAKPYFCILNARADGDLHSYSSQERLSWWQTAEAKAASLGLSFSHQSEVKLETPTEFNRRFPGSGGALYGRAANSPIAPFFRHPIKTRIPGLYLAGGSVHPSAGVPMAALSGWTAANTVMADLALIDRHHLVAMPGGISMPSATMEAGASRS